MSSLLRVEHVTISYNGKPVVQDVSFELKQGEILGIVGESGSGKSTIIKAVMGLLGEEGLVTKGDIWYKGENLTDMSTKELRRYLGKEIGMVFQDCKSALCPVRKIGVQIHEAVSEHEKASRHEVRNRAGEIMKKIGLNDADRVLDSYPFELSGGALAETPFFENERRHQLYDALAKLKPEYREALYLVYFEDMSYHMAAQVMNKNERQITNLIYRGKQSLKAILEKEGFQYADK